MKTNKFITGIVAAISLTGLAIADSGQEIYNKVCTTCHASGLAGAPRLGNAGDWSPRIANGVGSLSQSALKGTPKGMPAKGGHMTLPDAEVKAAVDFMLASVKDSVKPAEPKKDEAKKALLLAIRMGIHSRRD